MSEKIFLIWNDKEDDDGVCVFDFNDETEFFEFIESMDIKNPELYADGWMVDGEVEFLIIKGETLTLEKKDG